MAGLLSERVKQARLEAGLSQAKLADLMGASPRTVQMWEQGSREPSASFLRKLAAATGKPVGWFFEDAA